MICRSGQAAKKVLSEYQSTGLPHNGKNCFGMEVPIRKPEPPATMIAYFFIPRAPEKFVVYCVLFVVDPEAEDLVCSCFLSRCLVASFPLSLSLKF
jgi:hypothetical protein